ncbi:hypothetical protein ABKV19_005019 [Rosa sericea]
MREIERVRNKREENIWKTKSWLREAELIQDIVKVIWRKLHPSTSKSAINNVSSIPSSSSSFCRRKHDVFLSFRGKDIRLNFLEHLYAALIQQRISTFRDDKDLDKGIPISTQLVQAIEGSKVSVVIVSPDYASSEWCLDELVKILEFRKISEERKKYGTLMRALPQHEEKAHNLWKASTGFKNPLRNACERRMTEVRVLVNYDGEWVNSTYFGGKTKGIVISEDITYQGLVERVYGIVGVEPHEYKLILKTRYESKLPTQPVEIVNDDDLAFFIKDNLSWDMSSRITLCTTLERRAFPNGRVESSENSNMAHINRFGTYHSYFHGLTPDPVPYLQQQQQPFYQQQQPSYQQTWTWQPYYKPSYQQLQWGYQQPHHSYMPPQSSCQQPPEIFWHHYQPHMYPPTSYQ